MNKKIYNLAIRKRGECLLNKIKKIYYYNIYIYIYITNMNRLLKEIWGFKYDNSIQKRWFSNKSIVAK